MTHQHYEAFRSLELTRQPLYEQVADKVQAMIAERRLPPGTQLPTERELAGLLKINRTTVHQALGLLQQRGIVDMRVGSGTYVISTPNSVVADSIERYFTFGQGSVDDLIQLRAIIEPGLAALAAERATDAHIAELEGVITRTEHHFAQGNMAAYAADDARFHELLAACTGNELIVAISAALLGLVRDWLTADGGRHVLVDSVASHRAVYEAIAARHPQRARAAMEAHLQLAGDALCRLQTRHDGTDRQS